MIRMNEESPYTLHTLGNGLRVVIEEMPGVRGADANRIAKAKRQAPRSEAIIFTWAQYGWFRLP